MAVVVLVARIQEAPRLLHWAGLFGRARGEDVVALYPVSGKSERLVREIALDEAPPDKGVSAPLLDAASQARAALKELPQAEDLELGDPAFHLVQLEGRHPARDVVAQLRDRKATLVVVGRHHRGDAETEGSALGPYLFRHAPCNALMIRPGADPAETAERVLVPMEGGGHDAIALELAGELAAASGGRVTALGVQTHLGEDAEAVAEKALQRIVARAPGRHRDLVDRRVVLASSLLEGIAAEAEGYDLVLLGTTSPFFVRRVLFRTLPEALFAGPEGTSVAVVRRAIPLPSRIEQAFLRRVQATVPQLGRTERVALVDRLQASSQWNFDFVFLTGLSTLIAALGLIANNAPVVIGAMLIAPLMTPLIGAGLAIVYGNLLFLRRTLATVGAGFLLAVGIGVVVGLIPGASITPAMSSRGSPSGVDLAVAFASGMAAAYAIGRPGLTAALPGVAIAASLVPPIAAVGLALVLGDVRLAAGAALLFFTNLVAIVLGSALSLYAAGVRSEHLHGRQTKGVRRLLVAAFVFAAVLVIVLGFWVA